MKTIVFVLQSIAQCLNLINICKKGRSEIEGDVGHGKHPKEYKKKREKEINVLNIKLTFIRIPRGLSCLY